MSEYPGMSTIPGQAVIHNSIASRSGAGVMTGHNLLGREQDLALVLTKAKKFSLRFLFSLTIGTYQVLVLFCKTGRFKP